MNRFFGRIYLPTYWEDGSVSNTTLLVLDINLGDISHVLDIRIKKELLCESAGVVASRHLSFSHFAYLS